MSIVISFADTGHRCCTIFLEKLVLNEAAMIPPHFDKDFMNDPQKVFGKEYLLTSRSGAYSASTIGGCNTRKYHGLFITEQPQIDDNDHVIVSNIDEQITYKRKIYQIGTHKYPNTTYPTGYKYIGGFEGSPTPKWTCNLDDCVLVKEIMMPEDEEALLIRYTVVDAAEGILLNIWPFLAFRNVHELKRAGLLSDKKIQTVSNGIKAQLYPEYKHVYIQTSQKTGFVAAPDWYYNIEYPQEQSRGYNYAEDLFTPGCFRVNMKKGDKLVVYIGMEECHTKTLNTRYSSILKKRPLLNSVKDHLFNASRQFVIGHNNEVKIKAGYYWFGSWGRDTFISLPGLLLATGHTKEFAKVIKSSLSDLKEGLLPNIGKGDKAVYNSVDTSLWFIWAIQQYAIFTNSHKKTWAEYGKYLNEILGCYMKGTLYNIKMDNDGLISAGQEGIALTWMDAIVKGKPVTPRAGKAVEINALWYNAVCFCVEVAKLAGDTTFTDKWECYPGQIRQSFIAAFWDKDKQYLADCIQNGTRDWSIRPNQVLAVSMPYSPIPEDLKKPILDLVKEELLTPKGLRTLSPKDKNYKGNCEGDQDARDLAYHQGTIWPWLLGHFAEAYINEFGLNGFREIETISKDYEALMGDPCLYTIPEIYNGDYPYKAVGAVAQAWSVAELLRMEYLLAKSSENKKA